MGGPVYSPGELGTTPRRPAPLAGEGSGPRRRTTPSTDPRPLKQVRGSVCFGAVTAWWPLTKKMRAVVAAYLVAEAAAVAGELTTGTPGWDAVLAGALIGAAGAIAGYLTRDESSPTR
jgi:hypothetical protein